MTKKSQQGIAATKLDKPQPRKWTDEEDKCLLTCLLDLHNKGGSADNGYKPGYTNQLENMMRVVMPNTTIKADPHIASRLKTMRKNHAIVHDMVYGTNTSGFGWNSTTKCVIAEPAVWEAYLTSHKNASPFRNKSFPHFELMSILFGKDRATGSNAESAADAAEDIQEESITQGNNSAYLPEMDWTNDADFLSNMASNGIPGMTDNYAFPMESPAQPEEPSPPTKGGKKNTFNNAMIDAMRSISANTMTKMVECTSQLSSALTDTTERHFVELRKEFFAEIRVMNGLTAKERHQAGRVIGSDEALVTYFFSLAEEDKLGYLQDTLREK